MRTSLITALMLAGPCLQAQDPGKPTKPGGAKTVVDPDNNPGAAFNRAQWNQAIGLGHRVGRYGGRGLSAPRPHTDAGAIRAGLTWLKNCQQQDGSWRTDDDADTSTALTSLAILAMLGDGSTMRIGPYKHSIKRGIHWLRRQQETRQVNSGAFADATGPSMLATLAMTECYMLSSYKLLKKAAARGLTHLESLRHEDGGWRASPNDELSDPALTLWGICVLGTAADAGLTAAHQPDLASVRWLTGPRATAAPESGVLAKEPPATRQAELVFDQAAANGFAGHWVTKGCDEAQKAVLLAHQAAAAKHARTLDRSWTAKPGQKLSIHEWFCSSHLLAQSGDMETVAKITKALAEAQDREGEDIGSWQPIGAWGSIGGRVWTTAMAVLTLESPYRYAKLETEAEQQGR